MTILTAHQIEHLRHRPNEGPLTRFLHRKRQAIHRRLVAELTADEMVIEWCAEQCAQIAKAEMTAALRGS